jgi:hypothetical protein
MYAAGFATRGQGTALAIFAETVLLFADDMGDALLRHKR